MSSDLDSGQQAGRGTVRQTADCLLTRVRRRQGRRTWLNPRVCQSVREKVITDFLGSVTELISVTDPGPWRTKYSTPVLESKYRYSSCGWLPPVRSTACGQSHFRKEKTATADFKALLSLKVTSNDNLPRNVVESKVQYLSLSLTQVNVRLPFYVPNIFFVWSVKWLKICIWQHQFIQWMSSDGMRQWK